MIISIGKAHPGKDIIVRFDLPDGSNICFSATEKYDNIGLFQIEDINHHALYQWLKNKLQPMIDSHCQADM